MCANAWFDTAGSVRKARLTVLIENDKALMMKVALVTFNFFVIFRACVRYRFRTGSVRTLCAAGLCRRTGRKQVSSRSAAEGLRDPGRFGMPRNHFNY